MNKFLKYLQYHMLSLFSSLNPCAPTKHNVFSFFTTAGACMKSLKNVMYLTVRLLFYYLSSLKMLHILCHNKNRCLSSTKLLKAEKILQINPLFSLQMWFLIWKATTSPHAVLSLPKILYPCIISPASSNVESRCVIDIANICKLSKSNISMISVNLFQMLQMLR